MNPHQANPGQPRAPRLLPPQIPADPRSLDLDQRRELARQYAAYQAEWLPRLRALADGAPPEDDFPAFLLAAPAFAALGERVARTDRRVDLPRDLADQLDRFVEAFRDYLRTRAGEDAFAPPTQRAG